MFRAYMDKNSGVAPMVAGSFIGVETLEVDSEGGGDAWGIQSSVYLRH